MLSEGAGKLHHDAHDVLQLTHLGTGAKMDVLAPTHEFPQIVNTCFLWHDQLANLAQVAAHQNPVGANTRKHMRVCVCV